MNRKDTMIFVRKDAWLSPGVDSDKSIHGFPVIYDAEGFNDLRVLQMYEAAKTDTRLYKPLLEGRDQATPVIRIDMKALDAKEIFLPDFEVSADNDEMKARRLTAQECTYADGRIECMLVCIAFGKNGPRSPVLIPGPAFEDWFMRTESLYPGFVQGSTRRPRSPEEIEGCIDIALSNIIDTKRKFQAAARKDADAMSVLIKDFKREVGRITSEFSPALAANEGITPKKSTVAATPQAQGPQPRS